MKWIILVILFSYFVLSGYTARDLTNVSAESERAIWADYFGLLLIGLALVRARKIHVAAEYWVYLAYIIFCLVGILGARNQPAGVVELAVLAFNWLMALAMFHLWLNTQEISIETVMKTFLLASTVLAVVGLVNFFFMPDMFGVRPKGGLVGSFRNTGQAGAYFGLALAVAIPAFMSGLLKRNIFNLICLCVLLAALALTLKRAAVIGLAVGLFLFAIRLMFTGQARDRKIAILFLLSSVLVAPLVYLTFTYAVENVQGLEARFNQKFSEDSVESFSEGFLAENIDATWAALGDHPLMGSGLGNIIGYYTARHEIHSTYLSVLANTGILGMVFYASFMGVWIWGIFKDRFDQGNEGRFLSYFLPFLAGLMISWTYTYHLRKREFWILFFIVMACRYLVSLRKKANARQRPSALQVQTRLPMRPHSAVSRFQSRST